ncbi:hypothetical protein PS3A_25320 [Pseudomonas sp. 3A(2025)]
MKVCFIQSGGFAGMIRRYEVDTQTLQPAEAHRLQTLIDQSGLSQSGQWLDEQATDLKQYEIKIEDQSNTFCLTFDDRNIPDSVRPLLGFLLQQARPGRL